MGAPGGEVADAAREGDAGVGEPCFPLVPGMPRTASSEVGRWPGSSRAWLGVVCLSVEERGRLSSGRGGRG